MRPNERNRDWISRGQRRWLTMEYLLIFWLGPLALYPVRHLLAFRVVPLVLGLAVITGLVLIGNRRFDRSALWSTQKLMTALRSIDLIFLPLAALLTIATLFLLKTHCMAFPRNKPMTWAVVLLHYPPLAALPQQIFFRFFFFHRYRQRLPDPKLMIVASAFSFGRAHRIYANRAAFWLPLRSNPLPAGGQLRACARGNFLFTVGIGWFFYSGAIR